MELVVWLVFVLLPCILKAESEPSPMTPMVEVYSRTIGQYDKPNTLICHVKDFYPPEISVELLKNDVVIPGARNLDVAFTEKWLYHQTKFMDFTPKSGDRFSCKVTHLGKENVYRWEPDI